MKERVLTIGQKVALVLDCDDYIADGTITGIEPEHDGDSLTTTNPKDMVRIKITKAQTDKTELIKGNEVLVQNQHVYVFTDKKFHGEPVCLEHMETEDDYPYFCPELQENCFEAELN